MKKILILGGASAHCQVVRRAKEMGIYTIVTDYLPYENAPAKHIADESMQIDINDTAALVDYVKNHKVDGVLNFCLDPCTVPAFKVASECGLRTFGTMEQILAMTDKSLFKETCVKFGLPILKSYTMQDVLEGKISYPVMVKPRIRRGSRGVHICEDADAVVSAINELSEMTDGTEGYLIEEFASHESCPLFTIQYIVIAGEPYLVFFKNILQPSKYGLECYYFMTYSPSSYLDSFMDGDHQLFVRFIKKLGFKNGAMMFQAFLKDGHFRTVDMGPRFPGSGYSEALKNGIGYDVLEPMISYAVGNDMVVSDGIRRGLDMFENKKIINKIILLKAGTVEHISGFDILQSHPQVFSIEVRCHKGMVVPLSGGASHDAGRIFCVIKNGIDEIKKMLDFIDDNLVITDAEGNDMIIHDVFSEFVNYIK